MMIIQSQPTGISQRLYGLLFSASVGVTVVESVVVVQMESFSHT